MTAREFQARLRRRARRAGLAIPRDLATSLEAYFQLLSLWNRRINLTALDLEDGGEEVLDRLLIEALVAVRHLAPGLTRMVDIGSGGGSPAIPMKLAMPGVDLIMVEAKTRKSAFLREAIRHLGLSGASVENARYEELLARPELHEAADLVTVRAVRVEPRVLLRIQAFVRPGGQVFLFRGGVGAEAPAACPPPLRWAATHLLLESSQSRLVVLEKAPLGIVAAT